MRISLAVALLSLALAACGEANPVANVIDGKERKAAARQAAADNQAVAAGFEPAAPAPVEVPRVDPVAVSRPGAALPPATDKYRYLGRWAANSRLCADGAWRFETRKLTTAGETRCAFDTVANTRRGYDLQGTCEAEGSKTEQTLKLRFDEAKRTLAVTGQTLGPVELIYCGA